jgi:hypothetical protein
MKEIFIVNLGLMNSMSDTELCQGGFYSIEMKVIAKKWFSTSMITVEI